ncbi:MAG: FadR family transcriptional regulator [Spirochaetaceae bacterium]|jgi:GntR family transcriptional repressor for pyruvate dehydrogenase complex|nr:FadR family transcriptional regulator [Spirochaetaceae bacterium]
MSDIQKIKTKSLRSQVYGKLKEQVVKGVWKEGDKLPPEHKLCDMFGVSRVTIRGAIQQLEILGLVETKHGEGTFVKKFSLAESVDSLHPLMRIQKNHELITVLEYRKIIEKGIIGLAVGKIGPEDIAFLEETYAAMERDVLHKTGYIEADLAFHRRLAEITGNSIIIKVNEFISGILSSAMNDVVHLLGRSIGIPWHRKIINALKRGNKGECEALMEEHIEETIRAIERGGNFEGDSSGTG